MIERDAPSPEVDRKYRETPAEWARQRVALDTLIRAKGLERYAFFQTTGEGLELLGDLEEESGYVINSDGRVFSFWMGADPETGVAALIDWQEMEPLPHWEHRAAYHRARAAVGLRD